MRRMDNKNEAKVKATLKETYEGEIRLNIETTEDHIEVNRFCDILKEISDLRILSYNWSEKEGLNICISLKDPTTLDEKLLQIPLVEKVDSDKKSLTVVLGQSAQEESVNFIDISLNDTLAS